MIIDPEEPVGIYKLTRDNIISASRDGDTFTIKALAKDVKSSYRTIKPTAYENKTLKQIAEEIAQRHGYSLHFKGEDIQFTRLTQNQKKRP